MNFESKGEGQQFFFGHDAAFSREVGENDALDGKFGDDLAARAARRARQLAVCDDGECRKASDARSDGAEDGGALGAVRQAVGGVFDVAAREDAPVGRERRRADGKARIRRVGMGARFLGKLDEGFIVHLRRPPSLHVLPWRRGSQRGARRS